jgi:hypothetical protein
MSDCNSCSQNDPILNCNTCGPNDPEHQKLVAQKVQTDDEREAQATYDAKELVKEVLKNKDYTDDEIEVAPSFTVTSGERSDDVTTDYIIKLKGRRFMAIKCTMAIESRERHVVSFARVVDDMMIPYAAVTDGLRVHIMDTTTGKVVAETSCVDAFPSRDDALEEFARTEFRPYPPERLEKETRVLMAFECVACPKPKD